MRTNYKVPRPYRNRRAYGESGALALAGLFMSAVRAAFARTGSPVHADMPHWPAFDPDRYPTMVFGETVVAVNDPNRDERLALARPTGS